MVQFITLFLGALIAGPNEVRLEVHPSVTALEIRLDDEVVATLRAAPWEAAVDFGKELAPHLLEAVAYGAGGREIGRARQWVNLSPRDAEVTITLGRDPSSRGLEARVSWQSLAADNEPVGASATFDGEPLRVGDPRVITLPEHDPEQQHHLAVELEFAGNLRSTAEVIFGGVYGDEVDSELTAVPVTVGRRRELPAAAEMEGWFRARGRPLRVHAVEEGLAEIVVVRSPEAKRILDPRVETATRPILAKDHRLRFVGPRPVLVTRDHGPFEVFPHSEEIAIRVGGLRKTLGTVSLPGDPAVAVRLADAVAVAGLFANRNARRRAVVLITTGDSVDASRFDPPRVRAYLGRIGVPLVVWNPRRGAREAGGWGAALNVSNSSRLDYAYRELTRELKSQVIVWVDGRHLPQSIELAPEVEGVEMLR